MKKLILIGQLMLLLVFTSCSDWLDVNTDPNNPATVDAGLVLPAAEAQIAASLSGELAPLTGIWSQHWTQSNAASQFRNEDRYAITKSNYNLPWRELYSDALIDLDFVRKQAVTTENWNANLQATALMAYTYQILADFYDQIPFSEALQGEDGLVTPKFDNGQDVYDGLITMLDEALAKDLTATSNKVLSGDFLFGDGDVDSQVENWVKFANTLKLKIFMRQTKARPSVAENGVKALLQGGNFLDNGAAISVYEDAPDRSYPIYEAMVRQLNVATNLRGSHTLISFLKENNDSRIDVLFAAGAGGHFGLPQGAFDTPSTVVDPANVDWAVFDPTGAFYFFAPDEVDFLLAEANLRFGGAAAAKSSYDSGVNKAFSRIGASVGDLLTGSYAYPDGSFDANLEAIMTQKWVAAVERGHESFFDHNRTGYPKVSPVPTSDSGYIPGQFTYSITGTTNGLFPKRLIFPDRTTRNNPNAPADIPLTTPVWWDN